MTQWTYYNHALIPDQAPYLPVETSKIEDGSAFAEEMEGEKALLARWISDWDSSRQTHFWYCIKDTPWQVEKASKKTRYEVRKALKNFRVQLINPTDFLTQLYQVQQLAFSAYPKKYRPQETFTAFCHKASNWQVPHIWVYGAFALQGNQLIGYAVLNDYQHWVNFTALKVIPAYEREGVNAGIINKVLETLNPRIIPPFFISDGQRSLLHQTHFQDYLEKYFGFRKAYCKLHIKYRPGVDKVIKMLYPFRRIFAYFDGVSKIHQLNAVLKMEEICRTDARIEGNP